MAKGLPTETIVFAVSFLLIGAEFVFMGDSDDSQHVYRSVAASHQARIAGTADDMPPPDAPQPMFTEQEEIVPEGEEGEDGFSEDDFDDNFGQPLMDTKPLVSTDPDIEDPIGIDPVGDDSFDTSYGQGSAPVPMSDLDDDF